jgi:hypothetical protein
VARYNWEKLKKEFILGNYDSVRDYAAKNNIKYNGYFAKRTRGWADEKRAKQKQKESKIVDKTIEKIAEAESDRNATHLKF